MDDQNNTKNMISGLYDEFEKERRKLKNQYDNNIEKIDEIDSNITNYLKYDDENKVFSPRNITNRNDEKVIELRSEKEAIQNENDEIMNKLRYYEKKVNQLQPVIDSLSKNEDDNIGVSETGIIEDDDISSIPEVNTISLSVSGNESSDSKENSPVITKLESVDVVNKEKNSVNISTQLEFILNKVSLCNSLITTDIMRTKLELKNIEEYLSDLIDSIK